jgi:hypothetical protein
VLNVRPFRNNNLTFNSILSDAPSTPTIEPITSPVTTKLTTTSSPVTTKLTATTSPVTTKLTTAATTITTEIEPTSFEIQTEATAGSRALSSHLNIFRQPFLHISIRSQSFFLMYRLILSALRD